MKSPGCILLAAACASAFLPASLFAAATFSVVSSADTFVVAGDPTHDFGSAGAMQVSAPAGTNGDLQSLIRFNTATIKSQFDTQFGVGQWVLSSITLQTGTNFGSTSVNPNNPIFNPIKVGNFKIDWMPNDSWIEGTGTPAAGGTTGVNYNTLSSFLSGSDENLGTFNWTANGNTNPPTVPSSLWPLLLTSGFSSDVKTGGLISFHLYAADSNVSYLLNTSNFGTVANKPTLLVTADAVPEPASLLTMLGGAAALLLRSRRRR